jgi:hypothetical protein
MSTRLKRASLVLSKSFIEPVDDDIQLNRNNNKAKKKWMKDIKDLNIKQINLMLYIYIYIYTYYMYIYTYIYTHIIYIYTYLYIYPNP